MKCKITGVKLLSAEVDLSEETPVLKASYNFIEDGKLGSRTHGGCENYGPWDEKVSAALKKLQEVLEEALMEQHFDHSSEKKATSLFPAEAIKEPEPI
jgi:hypothetical protein